MNERVICPSPQNKFSVTILLKVQAKTADNLGHDLEDYSLRAHAMFSFKENQDEAGTCFYNYDAHRIGLFILK